MSSGEARCAHCSAFFTCGMMAPPAGGVCWCFQLPPRTAAPTPGSGCYCRTCLEEQLRASAQPAAPAA
ncbi:MAG: cysteine-rich CWC family protein [Candidatus Accumulibacter sp.]|uniref:cysteine-rich CWC family protein n=1 Tax=Accumulibacter sp. TaxID=2053492 RepID=UPI001A58D699|nr:cysteine-rich CWC family protein [Accumulibacter sp.]MBL8391475.1 cysteine-rich CWC family protein [Accumulibacter sp.]HRD89516.1 cysteine-rich CWC family protein [Accumulibacter sp.]